MHWSWEKNTGHIRKPLLLLLHMVFLILKTYFEPLSGCEPLFGGSRTNIIFTRTIISSWSLISHNITTALMTNIRTLCPLSIIKKPHYKNNVFESLHLGFQALEGLILISGSTRDLHSPCSWRTNHQDCLLRWRGRLPSAWWFYPSWKIWVNGKDYIYIQYIYPTYEMENEIHVWNHQPVILYSNVFQHFGASRLPQSATCAR